MKKVYLTQLFLLVFTLSSWAQVNYNQPSDILGDGYKIVISSIQSQKDNTQFKIEFFNTSRNQILTFDRLKIGVEFAGIGTYYYNTKMTPVYNEFFVIEPGESMYKYIDIGGEFDHKQERVSILIDGLSQGTIPEESLEIADFNIKDGYEGTLELDGFDIEFKRVSANKKVLTSRGVMRLPENSMDHNHVVFIDKSEILAEDENEQSVPLEITLIGKKPIDMDTDKNFILKTATPVTGITLKWGKAFKKVNLTPISLDKIEVLDVKSKKPKTVPVKTPTPVTSVPVPEFRVCDPITLSGRNGDVEFRIVSEVGCFKVYSQGELLNSEFTSSLTFNNPPGAIPVKLVMETGQVVEKKLFVGEDYEVAFYTVNEKNGKYSLKLSVFNSQAEVPTMSDEKLTDLTYGANEITCEDYLLLWSESEFTDKLTVVRVTPTEIVYVHCSAPDEVMRMPKRDVSFIRFSGGERYWISSVSEPTAASIKGKTLTREETYKLHLKE